MSTVPSKKESRREAGQAAIPPEMLAHGRMRQRIVAISRTRASGRRIAKDKYLRGFVRCGAITSNDLDSAVDACRQALSEFTWLTDVNDAVLGRADCAFLVGHGRFPLENDDFRLNGDYYRICRSLQYNLHYYDRELEQLPQALKAQQTASQGHPAPPQTTPRTEPSANASIPVKRGNVWAFAGVLAIGLVTAPILATIVMRCFPQGAMTAGLSMGGAWLVLVTGALTLTLPRRRR